jgi:ABC-type multidrug transport system ATPase subunit
MIELEHLVKKFGELTAVADVSLKIGRGEFFAMLGPNAAGKTTAIKLMTGLIKPTAGSARIGGFDIQTPAGLCSGLPLSLRQADGLGILPLYRPALPARRRPH